MRTLLWLLFASLVALSVAGCATTPAATYTFAQASGGPDCRRLAQSGDTMIKIYCSKAASTSLGAPEPGSADSECRLLAEPGSSRVRSFCGSEPEWSSFDIWAVDAGVTCRWTGGRGPLVHRAAFGAITPAKDANPQELCLTVAQWQSFEADQHRGAGDSAWELSPPQGRDMPNAGNLYGAGGYGYVLPGGAIGQELSQVPPAPPR